MCVCVDFVKRGSVYVLVLLSVGVLVTRVLLFAVFCLVCTVFLYCFVYVYYLFFLYHCRDYCHRVKNQLQ